ncbi:helix-turn-helix domain-containing protein [Peribacillus frigoritolerans]|uniref:helix-turn-helix domain-containing protein n=1 Tax=Peribacillus frigoritolerans TaxID=450367 RepID=UPI003D33B581
MEWWYTQQEVADLLGVSKATLSYAKQTKIIKIADPHRIHRETRYEKAEVDKLVIEEIALYGYEGY